MFNVLDRMARCFKPEPKPIFEDVELFEEEASQPLSVPGFDRDFDFIALTGEEWDGLEEDGWLEALEGANIKVDDVAYYVVDKDGGSNEFFLVCDDQGRFYPFNLQNLDSYAPMYARGGNALYFIHEEASNQLVSYS